MPARPIDLKEFLATHVKYEIDMLRATHKLLSSSKFEWAIQNALIESFWLHSRNLLEFFGEQKNAYPITRFFTSSYPPLDFSSVGPLYGKICAQISHLQDGRTDDDMEKLDPLKSGVLELLEQEIARFRSHLSKEYHNLISKISAPDKLGVSFPGISSTTTTTTTSTHVVIASDFGSRQRN